MRDENESEIKKAVEKELKRFFKPEFINRIDETILFNHLNKKDLSEIARLEFNLLDERLQKQSLELRVADEAIDFVVRKSFDHTYGARPLKRLIKKDIETRIANNMLKNFYEQKKFVDISVRGNEIIVN